jgi:hypothetical protein
MTEDAKLEVTMMRESEPQLCEELLQKKKWMTA